METTSTSYPPGSLRSAQHFWTWPTRECTCFRSSLGGAAQLRGWIGSVQMMAWSVLNMILSMKKPPTVPTFLPLCSKSCGLFVKNWPKWNPRVTAQGGRSSSWAMALRFCLTNAPCVCVCGNRYNKRLAVQFNILTSAGGARGTHWTGTNEDAGVYLWYQKGTPFWRTCAIGWNCCSSCCHSTFDASIIQAT